MSLLWVFGFLGIERGWELWISSRNLRKSKGLGGRELHAESYPLIVLLHVSFLAALLLESRPWRVPLDSWTSSCLLALLSLQALRYWCIATLGTSWNTRIIVIPGVRIKTGGPYRFLRHPNYLAVALEFVFLPALMRTPICFIVFFPLNLLILRQRIRQEEAALRQLTRYDVAFGRD